MTKATPVEAYANGDKLIELIFSDVDGTLVNPEQQLTPRTIAAVEAASKAGVPLIIATGKALGPWMSGVLDRLPLTMQRLHMQGNYIIDPKDGVIYNRQLSPDIFDDMLAFAKEHGLTFVAYHPGRVFCEQTNKDTDRLVFYGEPTPESIGDWAKADLGREFNKLLLMSDHPTIVRLRPQMEELLGQRAALTSALPGMIEVLPPGSSKGASIEWLLKRLGKTPDVCMAIGDGENDKEMLRYVGLGVAMGNAGPAAREAADVSTGTDAEDGVAQAIEKYVLAPRGIKLSQ